MLNFYKTYEHCMWSNRRKTYLYIFWLINMSSHQAQMPQLLWGPVLFCPDGVIIPGRDKTFKIQLSFGTNTIWTANRSSVKVITD